MKIYYKVLNRIKNNKLKLTNVGGIVSLAFGLRYGKINSIPTNFSLNYIPQVEKVHNFFNEDVQIMETKDNIIKTGDILLVSDKRISNGSKSALAIRSGEISKTNAGARAKADARKNVKARKQNSGSAIIPGAQALVPQNTYCRYHQYAPPSCKVRVTPGPGHDQDPGQDIPPPSPSEDSPFDESKYKGGSSPFLGKFNYDNLNHSRGNVDFSNKRRMSHSYDGHAKKCKS